LKELEMKLLYELMKNSRRSDRELAKAIGVSQPTVSRNLEKMQKDLGITFTAYADLGKVGFGIIALTFGRKEEKPMETQKVQELLEEYRNSIIFASTGTSSDTFADRMIISVHKSYSDYIGFRQYLQREWEGLVLISSSFLISLKSDKTIRPLSTHHLFENAIPEQ
jgi:DNA-binding Lrp family transcriptional regulator